MSTNYPFALTQPFTSRKVPTAPGETAMWFIFQGDRLLLSTDMAGPRIPLFRGTIPPVSKYSCSHYFGTFGTTDCYAVEAPSDMAIPPKMELCGLRFLFQSLSLPDNIFTVAGRARQILHWHKSHQFCGVCGTAMEEDEREQVKKCPACSHLCYPRLSPVVIMSVLNGNKILLARSPHFPPGMYSTLAGFVEPGETVEEAVIREVREEVSIDVRNIHYMASQPWPFPHSLMLGFTTEYAGGTLEIDNNEIEDARWFSPDSLPSLPSQQTIARLLINCFLEKQGK